LHKKRESAVCIVRFERGPASRTMASGSLKLLEDGETRAKLRKLLSRYWAGAGWETRRYIRPCIAHRNVIIVPK
jgi:hypothetical protein